jgi:hypothetical protein
VVAAVAVRVGCRERLPVAVPAGETNEEVRRARSSFGCVHRMILHGVALHKLRYTDFRPAPCFRMSVHDAVDGSSTGTLSAS